MTPTYPQTPALARRALARAILVIALASQDVAASPIQEEPAASPWQDRLETLRYWTPRRMQHAAVIPGSSTGKPIETPVTPGGDAIGYAPMPPPYARALPTRVTGQLFFHDPVQKRDAHCTASVVQSTSRRLIVTAAHCVVSITMGLPIRWYEHMMFVPAYDGTRSAMDSSHAPFGLWPLTRAYVSAIAKQNPAYLMRAEYDLALAGVFDDAGAIEDVVCGGLVPRLTAASDDPVLFPKVTVVGYPSAAAYSGAEQFTCESATRHALSSGGIVLPQCGLATGNSGGPVMILEDADAGDERVQVAAVVHTTLDQTRLMAHVYPALETMANNEHRQASFPRAALPCP